METSSGGKGPRTRHKAPTAGLASALAAGMGGGEGLHWHLETMVRVELVRGAVALREGVVGGRYIKSLSTMTHYVGRFEFLLLRTVGYLFTSPMIVVTSSQ